MITLYQLRWSHYVEKVRWALDYKGVDWSAVDVDPFTKHQMHHLQCKTTLDSGHQLYTVPTIHDEATGSVVGDSSEILGYLERIYPTPALYPAEAMEREKVARVGDRFTAADLTLAALLRPTMVVPFFRDHPRLQRLFDWRATQLQEHRREPQSGYEAVLHDARRRRGWALR